jgi:hypothetical protein
MRERMEMMGGIERTEIGKRSLGNRHFMYTPENAGRDQSSRSGLARRRPSIA